jgi:hypothetical protein
MLSTLKSNHFAVLLLSVLFAVSAGAVSIMLGNKYGIHGNIGTLTALLTLLGGTVVCVPFFYLYTQQDAHLLIRITAILCLLVVIVFSLFMAAIALAFRNFTF